MKEAIVDQPSSRQRKKKGACPESFPAEHLPHLVKKAGCKGNEQQAKDDKIGVLNPGMWCISPNGTDRLTHRGITGTKPSGDGESQHKEDRTNNPDTRT